MTRNFSVIFTAKDEVRLYIITDVETGSYRRSNPRTWHRNMSSQFPNPSACLCAHRSEEGVGDAVVVTVLDDFDFTKLDECTIDEVIKTTVKSFLHRNNLVVSGIRGLVSYLDEWKAIVG